MKKTDDYEQLSDERTLQTAITQYKQQCNSLSKKERLRILLQLQESWKRIAIEKITPS